MSDTATKTHTKEQEEQQEIAYKLQAEHAKVVESLRKKDPEMSAEAASHAWFFWKLAELELRVKKLETK